MQTDTQTQGEISSEQLRSAVSCWWPVGAAGYGVSLDEHRDDSAFFMTLTFTFDTCCCFSVGANSLWLTAVPKCKMNLGVCVCVCVCVCGRLVYVCVCDELTSSARDEALWRTGVGLCLSYCRNFSWICDIKTHRLSEESFKRGRAQFWKWGVSTPPSWGIPGSSHWRHPWGKPCPLCDWHRDAAERSAGPTSRAALRRRGGGKTLM